MKAGFVPVDGAELAFEVSASAGTSGLPLVFLHAGVCDGRMWQPQWERFGAAHPLLRFDRRGFGQARMLAPRPYSRVADALAVLDAAGLGPAVLVGCSQGGRVALDLALAAPQHVRALVLVAPAVSGSPSPVLDAAGEALSARIDEAIAAGRLDEANELEALMWLDGPGTRPGRVGGAVRDLFLAMNHIALHAADPGPAADEPSAWARLEQLALPTLVLWGDRDHAYLRERCEALVRRIPGARRCLLEGTAHLPNLEDPARFDAALADFIASL